MIKSPTMEFRWLTQCYPAYKSTYDTINNPTKILQQKFIIEHFVNVPNYYTVSFDSALGIVLKDDFKIYPSTGKISING